MPDAFPFLPQERKKNSKMNDGPKMKMTPKNEEDSKNGDNPRNEDGRKIDDDPKNEDAPKIEDAPKNENNIKFCHTVAGLTSKRGRILPTKTWA